MKIGTPYPHLLLILLVLLDPTCQPNSSQPQGSWSKIFYEKKNLFKFLFIYFYFGSVLNLEITFHFGVILIFVVIFIFGVVFIYGN